MSIRNYSLFLIKLVVGIVALIFLLISIYEIIDHTNDAPDMFALAQYEHEISPTLSPVADKINAQLN